MITFESLGPAAATARRTLASVSARLSGVLGKETQLTLEPAIDEPMLQRMLELERELFTIENNVYSKEDILSCLGEEDSLLVLLRIGGRIEGFVFGYDDDIEHPIVEGTEYFVDSAVVSSAYERLGIGTATGAVVLFLLYLAGYRDIGLTTEVRDKSGRELVKFYESLGFTRGITNLPDNYAMKIHLSEEFMNKLSAYLGSDAATLAH